VSGIPHLVVFPRLSELKKKHIGIREVYYHSTACLQIFLFCLKAVGKFLPSLFAFRKILQWGKKRERVKQTKKQTLTIVNKLRVTRGEVGRRDGLNRLVGIKE